MAKNPVCQTTFPGSPPEEEAQGEAASNERLQIFLVFRQITGTSAP
jgi:hypothetical protein